jgi:hypothetical protein
MLLADAGPIIESHRKKATLLQTLSLAAAGMLLGLAASSALSRSFGGLLFGVTSNDPLSFLGTWSSCRRGFARGLSSRAAGIAY